MKENKKTYAESIGSKPFDWNNFLNKEEYTEKELSEAEDLANNWVTCACGNQCSIIPRAGLDSWNRHSPIDTKLRKLGYSFMEAIDNMSLYGCNTSEYYKDEGKIMFNKSKKDAKDILQKIELHSSELIKEINDKQKG